MPIGTLQSINEITYDEVVSSYKMGYKLNNMCLLIIGLSSNSISAVNNSFNEQLIYPKYSNGQQIMTLERKNSHDYVYNQSLCSYDDEFIFIFFKINNTEDYSLAYIELLESITMTFIEELIRQELKIMEHDVIFNIVSDSKDSVIPKNHYYGYTS